MAKVWASYPDYLASPEWQQHRDDVLIRDDFRCRLCNSQRLLEVHHRCYDPRGWAYDDPENLTTLCRDCHERFHDAGSLGPKAVAALLLTLSGFVMGWLFCASF